ncbi:MAG: FecR domain-containing protein [Woeseiaceae bacterium]
MTELTKKQDITQQAAAWIARLDAGELSAEDLIELRDWATASPAHLRELWRLGDIWKSLDTLAVLSGLLAKPTNSTRRSWRPLAIAASAAVILVAVSIFFAGVLTVEPIELAAAYTTDIGEQTSIEPGEGSTINLNTGSQMTVEYSSSQRLVRLARGEAFFEVASEDERPFIVETPFASVVVTGTAFLVRVEASGLEVLVKEGNVELHERSGGPARDAPIVAKLKAGELAMIDDSGSTHIGVIEPEKMIRKLGWRDGMLMFDGETLGEVVREVSRYTSVRIVIDSPALREQRIGGYFKVGEVEDLLGTLQSDFGIEVHRVDDSEVWLTTRIN